MYSKLLDLKKAVLNAEDKAALRENACEAREAQLDNRADQLQFVKDSLAQDTDPKKELDAKLDKAYSNGKKFIIAADQSHGKKLQLKYSERMRQIKSDEDHHSALLRKMKLFAEIPTDWHIKVKDLAEIESREAADDGTTQPEKSYSAEETRFIKVCSNQVQNERNSTTWNCLWAMSGLWLIEAGALPKDAMTVFFEGDASKPEHMAQIGVRVGGAIQNSNLWRQGGYVDHNYDLMPCNWTDQDLEPPGDISKLPVKLANFWMGVEAGAKQFREEYARVIEQKLFWII
ncbi:hypothetical protein IQ06DRAFT_346213 [Phaeosphaeriaceae sp. SRC1lsM3a]|nr:hypothetical protein IQ06DRAFT_346213 [Stagonospora sp. SRC1lsM3a]